MLNRLQSWLRVVGILCLIVLFGSNLYSNPPLDSVSKTEAIKVFTLSNSAASLKVSPDIGGRVVHYSLLGKQNVLKVNSGLLEQGRPQISLDGPNRGYMGHINWVGPQNEWWLHQNLNPQRRLERAEWPPDPYTVLASANQMEASATSIVLTFPPSPVTGLALTKHYNLDEDRVDLRVKATNKRKEPVSWDMWFNSRLSADSTVYVPVHSKDDVWYKSVSGSPMESIARFGGGVMSLDYWLHDQVIGKAFVQPSAGWMAAFTQGQLFLIEFKHLDEPLIHPLQGQVELYIDHSKAKGAAGMLEMELHSAYRTLSPEESMSATETWRIFAYSGPATFEAHVKKLQQLGYLGRG